MNTSRFLLIAVPLLAMLLIMPSVSAAATPTLSPPPSTLPGITYYIENSNGVHYTVVDSEWKSFFKDVIDNSSYVSYNWSSNLTQYLIVYDLSYKGMNQYGQALITALTTIGFPSIANMSKAFNITQNKSSQISGYSNIQALDAGAFPGFSWSVPIKNNSSMDNIYFGILGAIVASIVVLYYVFNRKK